MTGKKQRGRILLLAEGIKLARAFEENGELETVARLLELDKTRPLSVEQETVLAYAIAHQDSFKFNGDYQGP